MWSQTLCLSNGFKESTKSSSHAFISRIKRLLIMELRPLEEDDINNIIWPLLHFVLFSKPHFANV